MYLSVTSTAPPATDLGYLVGKHPDRLHATELPFGTARVVYPEASEERCTVALVVDVDPVALVRGKPSGSGDALADQHVNDRPYAASSLLSVALKRALGSALGGRCTARPHLAAAPLPLTAKAAAVPCRGDRAIVHRLFAPLGLDVDVAPSRGAWGEGVHAEVTLAGRLPLKDLLTYLYVLLPVLDDRKHYYVGEDEVEKLLRHGSEWLPRHPERELITRRYLKHRRSLVDSAMERILRDEEVDPDARVEAHADQEAALERPLSLDERRRRAVAGWIVDSGATTVVDMGCGEGRLLAELVGEPALTRVVGMDVSHRALERASARLRLDQLAPRRRERVELLHGSLGYRDARLAGFDAAALVEVIEHVEPARLATLERVVFEHARPRLVVVTTPNAEYNVLFPQLASGRFRHPDHRFEWTRAQFQDWAGGVAQRHGYAISFEGIGEAADGIGPPTQAALFRHA